MKKPTQAPQRPQPALPDGAPRARLVAGALQCDLDRPVSIIGGRKDCHLPLAEPDVSKLHAAVVNTGRQLFVIDLQSRSGTFVDDQPVRLAELTPASALRFGPAAVRIEFAAPGAADALPPPLRVHFAGQTTDLTTPVALLGRRSACDVAIDSPDISLAHALLLRIGGCPAVCDLGSRSGTWLNGDAIDLAWLADGDRLVVGGEEMTLGWDGPVGFGAARPRGGAPSAAGPRGEADSGVTLPALNLDDLESTLSTLQAYVSNSRSELGEQTARLQEREAQVLALAQDLDRREAALQAALATLEERSAEIEAREKSAADAEQTARQKLLLAQQRERVLDAQRKKLAQEQDQVARQRGDLQTWAAELEAARQRHEVESESLTRRAAEFEAACGGYRQREAALTRRAEELQALALRLTQREAALTLRETMEIEAARKIDSFKTALRDATEAFATRTFAAPAAAGVMPAAAAQAAPAVARDTPGAAAETAAAAPAANLRERYQAIRRLAGQDAAEAETAKRKDKPRRLTH